MRTPPRRPHAIAGALRWERTGVGYGGADARSASSGCDSLRTDLQRGQRSRGGGEESSGCAWWRASDAADAVATGADDWLDDELVVGVFMQPRLMSSARPCARSASGRRIRR